MCWRSSSSGRSIFRSTASAPARPITSARRGAIPMAGRCALRCRARSRSTTSRRPSGCSSICCRTNWTGEPPGLPQEVVEELARRTRNAEKDARQRAELAQLRAVRPVNVRIAKQPTFTRFIFELPELTGVTTDRGKDKLTLKFAKPLRFDLSDAKLTGAEGVGSIDASLDVESSEVRFALLRPGRRAQLPRGLQFRGRRQRARREARGAQRGRARPCCAGRRPARRGRGAADRAGQAGA